MIVTQDPASVARTRDLTLKMAEAVGTYQHVEASYIVKTTKAADVLNFFAFTKTDYELLLDVTNNEHTAKKTLNFIATRISKIKEPEEIHARIAASIMRHRNADEETGSRILNSPNSGRLLYFMEQHAEKNNSGTSSYIPLLRRPVMVH